MRKTLNYEAFWVPGLDRDDVHPDDALKVAFEWLRGAERKHGGRGDRKPGFDHAAAP